MSDDGLASSGVEVCDGTTNFAGAHFASLVNVASAFLDLNIVGAFYFPIVSALSSRGQAAFTPKCHPLFEIFMLVWLLHTPLAL
jgi:hypothetical protein